MLGDLLAPHDAAGIHGEVFEQRVLLGRQRQFIAPTGNTMRARVEAKIADLDDRILPRSPAPQQGTQARQQLRELERLDQVIVGAGVETFHAIGHGVAGGEHQDRGADSLRA